MGVVAGGAGCGGMEDECGGMGGLPVVTGGLGGGG